MNSLKKFLTASARFARQAACAAPALYLWSLGSPALAAAKKKVVEEAATKSYSTPYLIVIMMIAMGLMAVGRPSRRADKPDDSFKKSEEE